MKSSDYLFTRSDLDECADIIVNLLNHMQLNFISCHFDRKRLKMIYKISFLQERGMGQETVIYRFYIENNKIVIL